MLVFLGTVFAQEGIDIIPHTFTADPVRCLSTLAAGKPIGFIPAQKSNGAALLGSSGIADDGNF